MSASPQNGLQVLWCCACSTSKAHGKLCVLHLGGQVPPGPGDSWDLGKIHSSQRDEWGFPTLANKAKVGKRLPVFAFFFPFPCGSRINALKSHPGFNLLWLSPRDWVVDLCFSFLTWEFLLDVKINPGYFCLFLGSGDASQGPAYILSCVRRAEAKSYFNLWKTN